MATNNSINKTSDTFVATTSITTPLVTCPSFANSSSGFALNGLDMVLSGSTGIKYPTTGGTASVLNYYEQYTNTITIGGIWAVDQTVVINITRIGNSVNMYLKGAAQINATTSGTITAAAGSIPTRFLGLNDANWGGFIRNIFLVRDNAVDKLGVINITEDGAFSISAGPSVGIFFVGSGISAYPDQPVSWSL